MPVARKKNRRFTYDDYVTWPDDERWELIDGQAYDMSPAPGTKHQTIIGAFGGIIRDKLLGHPCRPFIAPTDVVFSGYDVVQPDVLVVCDPKKITEANIQGAPDLIIEAISPSTSLKDRREKKALYEKHGVKEYVIVYPAEEYLEIYRWEKSRKKFSEPVIFDRTQSIRLASIGGVEIALEDVFRDPTAKK